MKYYTTVIVLALVMAGCSANKKSYSTDSFKDLASYPECYVKYKSWTGVSTGAEINHSSLKFVELDLSNHRMRKFMDSASRPDPMLPYGDSAIAKVYAHVPWIKLTPEQVSTFLKSIQAWLNTKPPSEYNSPMTLGSEDGHVTRLTVTWGRKTISTTLNPRGGFRENDPLKPPEEWNTLIKSLISLSKMP